MLSQTFKTLLVAVALVGAPVVARQASVAQDAQAGAGVPGVNAAVLELRTEATIEGAEIRLRQICRWSQRDNAYFASLGDMVIERFKPGQLVASVSLATIREVLEGAGVSGGEISFRGAVEARIRRSDVAAARAYKAYTPQAGSLDEMLRRGGVVEDSLPNGMSANEGTDVTRPVTPGTQTPSGELEGGATLAADRAGANGAAGGGTNASSVPPLMQATRGRTLREALVYDVVSRLNLKPEDVEVTLETQDARVLNVAEPAFRWQISPMRVKNLGPVTWSITLYSGEEPRRITVSGYSRAWFNQLVLTRGVSAGQVLQVEDYESRRVLLDRLPEEQLLRPDQARSMQVIRDLPANTALHVRMVQPVLLVRTNQLVTLTLRQGAFEVKAVARAKESGGYGAVIRVENETTRQALRATVVGPQEVRVGPEDAPTP